MSNNVNGNGTTDDFNDAAPEMTDGELARMLGMAQWRGSVAVKPRHRA